MSCESDENDENYDEYPEFFHMPEIDNIFSELEKTQGAVSEVLKFFEEAKKIYDATSKMFR